MYGPQGIQSEGWLFKIGEEKGIESGKHGKGPSSEKKQKHWAVRYESRWKDAYKQYWIGYELNTHRKKSVYPDWGCLADRYMENKRRDHKSDRDKRKEAANKQKREYSKRPEVRKRHAQRTQEKRAVDPSLRMRKSISCRLSEVMNGMKVGSVMRYVGCTDDQLRSHIESQFKRKIGWHNYGTHWHIDHIIPCASFDHTDPKQVAQCWHWTNMRPLEARKNLEKGDSITEPQMQLLLCATH